jgi:anti-sigma regulatory factor (Ser/Thr protein kinase)
VTSAEYRLEHAPSAAARARRLTEEALRDRLPGERLDDFLLVVTELVTNAVRHAPPEADGRIVLRLEAEDDVLRAIVIDGGQRFSFEQATFDATTGHMGLHLTDQLADRWGLSLDGEKAVWFEIEAPVEPMSPTAATAERRMPR